MTQTIHDLCELFTISNELQRKFELLSADPVSVLCEMSNRLTAAESYIRSHKQIIPLGAKWSIGDTVAKKQGSSWRGKVVGYYTTANTPIGYCVESLFESGSVQVWPEAALVDWKPETDDLKAADPKLGVIDAYDGYSISIMQTPDGLVWEWVVRSKLNDYIEGYSRESSYEDALRMATFFVKHRQAVKQLLVNKG